MQITRRQMSLLFAVSIAGLVTLEIGRFRTGPPLAAYVSAAPPESNTPPEPKSSAVYECRFAKEPITIDGRADEDAWKSAEVIDHFYLPWLGAKARPAVASTVARLLWDAEYIYFFANLEDHDLYADVKQHNGPTWNNDVFELFFKPATGKTGYYEFEISPANTMFDLYLPSRGSGGYGRWKDVFKFHWETKTVVHGTLDNWLDRDQGWAVEGRIPWTDFAPTGGQPAPEKEWKFTLCRCDYSSDLESPELSTTAPLDQQNFHQYENYATVRFVGPKK